MKGCRAVPELTDQFLRDTANRISEARDEHATFKVQGRRELAAVLNVINSQPRPPDPPATVEAAQLEVDKLQMRREAALGEHYRRFPTGQTTNSQGQQSLQRIAAIDEELMWAKRRVKDLENAQRDREARGLA
jgi:hypothetical protein